MGIWEGSGRQAGRASPISDYCRRPGSGDCCLVTDACPRKLRLVDTRASVGRAHQLRRQNIQGSWASSVGQSSKGPQTAGLVIHQFLGIC